MADCGISVVGHLSVKDFLTSERMKDKVLISPRLGRERLGQTSLVYILMPETTYIRSRLKPQQLSTKNLHLRELRTQI